GGERETGPGRPLKHEPPRKLRRDVLSLRRASAVAEQQDATAGLETAHDRVHGLFDFAFARDAVVEVAPLRDAFGHGFHVRADFRPPSERPFGRWTLRQRVTRAVL